MCLENLIILGCLTHSALLCSKVESYGDGNHSLPLYQIPPDAPILWSFYKLLSVYMLFRSFWPSGKQTCKQSEPSDNCCPGYMSGPKGTRKKKYPGLSGEVREGFTEEAVIELTL